MIDVVLTIEGKQCRLEVTEPMGTGGGFHVMLDRYYQGCIVLNSGQWVPYLHQQTKLPQRITDRIMEVVNSK